MINLTTEKGSTQAYVALPAAGTGPGVLLLHAWWGLNGVFRGLADRLAAEGFVVLAPDLNLGETVTTVEAAKALMPQRDNERTALIVAAAHDALRQHPAVRGKQIGVIGFSMGAAWALWLSTERPAQVAATVVFYGTYPLDFSAAQAVYLGHFAEGDEWEPPEDVQAMEQALREAGREVTFHSYPNTAHWFMEDDRPEYNAEAATQAWQRTMAFLHEQLKSKGGD